MPLALPGWGHSCIMGLMSEQKKSPAPKRAPKSKPEPVVEEAFGDDFLTPETFSFFEVFSEQEYPTDEVELCTDEVAAIGLRNIMLKISMVPETEKETLAAFVHDAEKMQARLDRSRYRFDLQGVSDDTISDLRDIASSEFEAKKKPRRNAAGHLDRILPESEQMAYVRYYNALCISVHIKQITNLYTGAVMTAPGADEIATFMDKAPTAEKNKLNAAIDGLRAKSEDFERRIDPDFLAKR